MDKKIVERGYDFRELKENPIFKQFYDELVDRIEVNHNMVKHFRLGTHAAAAGVEYYLYRYQGYQELLDWFEDVIEEGENEIRAAIQKDPQEYATPTGNREE